MKKKSLKNLLLAGVMAAGLVISGAASTVSADTLTGDPDWSVTFNKDKKMESNFKSSEIYDIAKGMQPGDELTITVNLKNSYTEATDWYMENTVLDSLETSANGASAGGYDYKLTYYDAKGVATDFFDSTVGGDQQISGREGLKQATITLEDWFGLSRLQPNETGKIELTVVLDGETQGNAYQDTLADLNMQFAVEVAANGTPVPPTNTPRTSVRTGDQNQPLLYLILTGLAGLVLLILAIRSVVLRRAEAAADSSAIDRKRKGGR